MTLNDEFRAGNLPAYSVLTFPVFAYGAFVGFYIDPQAFFKTRTIH